MIGWVEASLYEAISCRAPAWARNDLASDSNRLLDTLDFDDARESSRNAASEAIDDRLTGGLDLRRDLVDLLRQFSEAIGGDARARCTW